MTKQDFELIATTLRERESHALRSHWDSVMRERTETIEALASALATTNPRFNRSRFIAACMGEDSRDSAGRAVRYSAK